MTVADKFIMLGDFYILNPNVKNEKNLNFVFDENEKLKMNYSRSLFQRLFNQDHSRVTILPHQYRMNKQIMSFVSSSLYSDSLLSGIENDELIHMNSDFNYSSIAYPFLRYACYPKPWVALINTSNLVKIMQDFSSSCINAIILNLVIEILLTTEVIIPDDITVISNLASTDQDEILNMKGVTNYKTIDNLYDAENSIIICNIITPANQQDIHVNNLFRMWAAFGKATKNKDILLNLIIINILHIDPQENYHNLWLRSSQKDR